MKKINANKRFDSLNVPVTESGCFIWLGCVSRGYGKFLSHTGKQVQAHRFSFERANGPIGDGLEIDHLCRVPICVNPAHLEVVTRKENNRRSFSPSGINSKKTQCGRGHAFSVENTYLWNGRRICKECRRSHSAVYYQANRETYAEYMKSYYRRRKSGKATA